MTWRNARAKKVDHEHNHQSTGVAWAHTSVSKYPKLALLYAVPNGGDRHPAVAAKLKAEGVKAGQPDLCLPVACRGFHSLYIETKVPKTPVSEKTYPSKLQKAVMGALADEGNLVVVCWGATAIIETLEWYLSPLVYSIPRQGGKKHWLLKEAIDYLSKLENVEVINAV